ncbi:MAG: TetR/AcrR family transcriptional regulator [Acidobacteriota bacterium]|nr:TetR/AcrR family transcriptional regulator [Acidobacteriota bacterium]
MNQAGENRRHLLIHAAARLFREKGFDRATIRDLARAVNLQSGSIFHYFGSKDDILVAVMEDAVDGAVARLKAATATGGSTRAVIRALIRAELGLIHDESTRDGMEVTFYAWDSLTEEARRQLLARRDAYEGIWLEWLAKARAENLVHLEPGILRRFLNGSQVWTVKWFRPGGAMDLESLADQTLAMITGAPAPDA